MTLRGNDSDREPMAMAYPQELRELTYELLRKIEHKLGGLSDILGALGGQLRFWRGCDESANRVPRESRRHQCRQ